MRYTFSWVVSTAKVLRWDVFDSGESHAFDGFGGVKRGVTSEMTDTELKRLRRDGVLYSILERINKTMET